MKYDCRKEGDVILIFLADEDEKYVKLFCDYISRSLTLNQKVKVKGFTTAETLSNALQGTDKPNIVLAGKSLWDSSMQDMEHGVCVIELAQGQEEALESAPFKLAKYQSIDDLLQKIEQITLHQYMHSTQKSGTPQQHGSCVISVASAAGGVGKTTFCRCLIQHYVNEGKKVLYCNIETFSSWLELSLQEKNDALDRLFYYLQSDSDQVMEQLKACMTYDEVMQCHVLPPIYQMEVMQEVTVTDMQKLIDMIRQLGLYDVIILDHDAGWHVRLEGSSACSDVTLWLMSEAVVTKTKTQQLLHYLLHNKKVQRPQHQLVMNKVTNEETKDWNNETLPISMRLPYVPQWKSLQVRMKQDIPSVYLQEINKWLTSKEMSFIEPGRNHSLH
ncbi:AAA family ATPase [Longirhabdus pacifica]|uniref:AAA family ATPase n=1 Tax=Longirhabdus pacifica TaxID=2305227 RepID=UPI001008D618|nr:AAA family ATPase [Longirhabdus pacifica]